MPVRLVPPDQAVGESEHHAERFDGLRYKYGLPDGSEPDHVMVVFDDWSVIFTAVTDWQRIIGSVMGASPNMPSTTSSNSIDGLSLGSPSHMVAKSASSEVELFGSPDHLVQYGSILNGFGTSAPPFAESSRTMGCSPCQNTSGMANTAASCSTGRHGRSSSPGERLVSSTRVLIDRLYPPSTSVSVLESVNEGMEHRRRNRSAVCVERMPWATVRIVSSRSSNRGVMPVSTLPCRPATVTTLRRGLIGALHPDLTVTWKPSVSNGMPLSL